MISTKEDIEFHNNWGGRSAPAVNVKVYGGLADGFRDFQKYEPEANPHFTLDWIESHVSDNKLDDLFWIMCEYGFEQLQSEAEEIFGKHVKVYSEGRSGGWAVVDGIDSDVDNWDAIDLAKWRKFTKIAQATADDVMYRVVDAVYYNDFEAWVTA